MLLFLKKSPALMNASAFFHILTARGRFNPAPCRVNIVNIVKLVSFQRCLFYRLFSHFTVTIKSTYCQDRVDYLPG